MTEGMVLHDADGTIIDCNVPATRILGLTRNQILGKTSRDPSWRAVREDGTAFPGEKHPAMIVMKTGQPCRQVVMGLHLPKGVLRWININAEPLFQNGDANLSGVFVTFSDITERKQVAQELKEVEVRYHDLYENAPDMYLSTDSATGRVIRCNQTFLNATGYTRDEVIGRPIFELYQPESQPIARQALKEFVATGYLQNLEMTLKRKDGSALPILLSSSAVRDAQGRILHSRSILRDITARKQVEEALRKSEERFRAITNLSPDIISIFDDEGRLVFNSAAAIKIHGYQPADLEGRSTFDFIHPDDRAHVTDAFGNLLKNPNQTVEVQYRYRNADGSYNWMEAFGTNELANPHINGIIAISRDITTRKQAEEALQQTNDELERRVLERTDKLNQINRVLQKSEAKFSAAFKYSPTPMNISRVEDGSILDANNAFFATTGHTRNKVINSNIKALGIWVEPKKRDQIVKQLIDQGEVTDIEFEFRKQNGRLGTGIYSAHLIHLNNVPHILSAVNDITERKNMTEALRRSEEWLNFALESIHAGAWSLNLTNHTAFRSPKHDLVFGYANPLPKWTYKTFLNHVLPEDRAAVDGKFQTAVTGQINYNFECRIRRADGEIRWITSSVQHYQNAVDGSHWMAGIVQDVTDHKQAAVALEQSEARFRQISANIEDVLYWVDSKSREFNYISPVFERMLGYTLDDVTRLGGRETFLAAVIQGGQFKKQRALFRKLQAAANDTTPHWQTWWRCKDGSLKFIEDSWLPVYFEGKLQYTYGVLRNITERVRLEEEVLNISDWERRRIAQDLHDGLGQILVVAGFLINTLHKDLVRKPNQAVRQLNRIQEVIGEATQQARELAHDVQPVEPEPDGLMSALAKLAQQMKAVFNIHCEFKCRRPVSINNHQTATHLFRIAQEAMTNAIKHGQAKRILIRLTQTPKQINLTVKDDGLGLTNQRQKKTGMGMNIMRYRAGIIGGLLTIRNDSTDGAIVACTVPIAEE